MDLNTVWFILIAILYVGYFVLEGFDFGVGILLPFLGKDDTRRRMIINTIGPHWDGNEVWLITAGGATFAAFPGWYATLFSGFYLPLFLILLALILRGVAFEFRSKDENPVWRSLWDWAIFFGSLIPALLWGVAFGNLILGTPIDASMNYVGGFWNLLNPFALICGMVSLAGFIYHGAMFLSLKVSGKLLEDSRKMASVLWIPTAFLLGALIIFTITGTSILSQTGASVAVVVLAVLAELAVLASGWMQKTKREGWAFALTSASILLAAATVFVGLFPRVMVSNLDPALSLTIYNTASGPNTLQTMTIVAVIFVPIVLAYQAWTYWIFRKRISDKKETLHY
jgi:cytochrome d ubiquinol oxidase subunit II